MEKKLTERQKLFIQEFLKDRNATQAVIRAGYSKNGARSMAVNLLANPNIAQEIDRLSQKRCEKVNVTVNDVLAELAKIAFTDMKDLASWTQSGVEFKPSSQLGNEKTAAISELSETVTNAGGTLKIKKHDKVKALELLGKYLSMWSEKLDVTNSDGSLRQSLTEDQKRKIAEVYLDSIKSSDGK